MFKKHGNQSAVWLLIGLVAGLGVAGVFQAQPSFATATDHADEFAIATGPLNDGTIEAVYLLDFKTGSLLGTVMSRQAGKFQAYYKRDLGPDFGLKAGQKPKFIMVTGLMQATTSQVPIGHALYVAELNSGKINAYIMPYRGDVAGGTTAQALIPLDSISFRQQANVRAQ
jgi:hypothetical protein